MGLIQKRDHTNTLVTVVRYFGGVKLGTGGLVRAYSGAAKLALEATKWEPLLRRLEFQLTIGYEQWPVVEPVLQQAGVTGLETRFSDEVAVTGRIVDSAFSALEQQLTDLCRGRISINISGQGARASVDINGSLEFNTLDNNDSECGNALGSNAESPIPALNSSAYAELWRELLFINLSANARQNTVNEFIKNQLNKILKGKANLTRT